MKFLDRCTHMALKAAMRVAGKLQGKKGKARPAELLLMLPLTPDVSEYNFPLDTDSYRGNPMVRGLAYRNGFNATGMAIGLAAVKLNAAGEPMFGGAPIVYHPDARIFDGAAADPANEFSEAEALNCIYHGRLEVQTNEGLRLDNFLMNRFYTAETTQAEPGATVNEAVGNEVNSLGGVIQFKGGDDNFLKVSYSSKDKQLVAGTATRRNYLCVRLIGAEIKGDTTSRIAN